MTSNTLVGYKKLIAWQLADKLAWEVYLLTDKFPKDEIYGLTSQLRRAVLSVVLNIV
ncbi:MAG: S23 ribosomal protein, partial [Candidatus Woesebacteria bacterium GW2011_GWA1_39_21b]